MGSESLAFKDWLKSEGLVQSIEVSQVNGQIVGIDAEDYVDTLLTNTQTREPLLPALGGLPFALQEHVDKDLENFRAAGVEPRFVFNGMGTGCDDRRTISKGSQKAMTILDEAWKVYDQGRGDDAVVAFGKACTYRTSHIVRYLQSYLAQKGVYTYVAPYSAAAQLEQFERTEKPDGIDVIAGSASVLVFGGLKVITEFDWDNKKIHYAHINKVLAKLNMSHPQFVDLCLLSGSSLLDPIPEIDNDATTSKITAAKMVLGRAGNDGLTACRQSKDEEYTDLFKKAKTAVKHMVIIHGDGQVHQLKLDDAPGDTHGFMGQRLPDELMSYHMRGFVGSRVLNWRAHHEIFETPPLDGGNSQAYKDLVQDKLRPMRARCLALLSKNLHRYFAKQDVNLVCWFNENDKRALGIPDMALPEMTRDAESWHVIEAVLNQASKAQQMDPEKTPIQYTIALLSDDAIAKKTVTHRKEGECLLIRKTPELVSNILGRFLQERGYINSDHTLSAWGKALRAAFERASSERLLGNTHPANEAEDAIFVAFELLRLDMLNSKPTFPQPPYTGAPMRGTDADKANVNLISRVACLGSFQHDAIGYTGPLSRHLLAFHQVAAAVRNTLRDLAEMHGCNMFLTASAHRYLKDYEWASLVAAMPFGKEPDLGLGLVVKSHLDELSQEPSRRADIKKWFNHAIDIDADLAKAWKMWDSINAGVQAADSAIVSSETKNMFQNADTWLQQKRQVAPLTNGTNGA